MTDPFGIIGLLGSLFGIQPRSGGGMAVRARGGTTSQQVEVSHDLTNGLVESKTGALILTGANAVTTIRNGTTAQTLFISGTYTNDSNYTRFGISWFTSTAVLLAPETAGSGADNIDLIIQGAGTGKVGVGVAPVHGFTVDANVAVGWLSNQSQAASRRWRIANDIVEYGDLGIQQSTTQNGTSYTTIVGLNAAGTTLTQRNGTNAQAFIVTGTYTDASNYVQGKLSASTTAVTLAAETAGSGADDINLILLPAGAGSIGIDNTDVEAWSSMTALEGLDTSLAFGGDTDVHLSSNAYYNGSWLYKTTDLAANYYQYKGTHNWRVVASGTINSGITWIDAMTIAATGNVCIGSTSPNANAILDLQSTTKAFMPPRMTTTQRDAVATPTAGMVVYNSTTNKLNVYTTAWEAVTSA